VGGGGTLSPPPTCLELALFRGPRAPPGKARAAERRIRSTILEIFGERSPEYRDHQYHDISGGMSVVVGGFGDEPDAHEDLQENFVAGIRRTVTMLGSLIDTIKERTKHAVDSVGRARVAFEGLDRSIPPEARSRTERQASAEYRREGLKGNRCPAAALLRDVRSRMAVLPRTESTESLVLS
jgi:hypothetical protein